MRLDEVELSESAHQHGVKRQLSRRRPGASAKLKHYKDEDEFSLEYVENFDMHMLCHARVCLRALMSLLCAFCYEWSYAPAVLVYSPVVSVIPRQPASSRVEANMHMFRADDSFGVRASSHSTCVLAIVCVCSLQRSREVRQ